LENPSKKTLDIPQILELGEALDTNAQARLECN
jgi:hypothetical protein